MPLVHGPHELLRLVLELPHHGPHPMQVKHLIGDVPGIGLQDHDQGPEDHDDQEGMQETQQNREEPVVLHHRQVYFLRRGNLSYLVETGEEACEVLIGDEEGEAGREQARAAEG